MKRGTVIASLVLQGHEGRVLSRDGSHYPTAFVVECVTCRKRLRRATGCHNVYAPAYLEPDLRAHIRREER